MNVGAVLRQAEDHLRARGLTGAQAFEALLDALEERRRSAPCPHDLDDVLAPLPAAGDIDLFGLAYERFFADVFKGRAGQYFTPRPVVDLILARLPVEGATVLDPTCGSGGLLVAAGRRGARVHGIERSPLLARLARSHLALAGIDGEIDEADFFAAEPELVDVVVANPPFSVELTERSVVDRYETVRHRDRVLSDWVFVEALERWVKPGGHAGVVLPWSVLQNPRSAFLRERIADHWTRLGQCALPEGVFRPFGGAAGRAFVLWLRRGRSEPHPPIPWSTVEDPGYDVRSLYYRPTGSREIGDRIAGRGWTELAPERWVPAGATAPGVPLGELVEEQSERFRPARTPDTRFVVVDLADTDKRTGEVVAARRAAGREVRGQRVRMSDGDLLVSRLRPELNNVVMARRPGELQGQLIGSPEWLVLTPTRWHHVLLAGLRSPAWRAQLPEPGGQTRPRTTPEAVLNTRIRLPDSEVCDRLEAALGTIRTQRALLADRLSNLQALMDAWSAGELDEGELVRALDELESPQR